MTKEEFFQKDVIERKLLIARAHRYYQLGLSLEPWRIPEDDIREFIEMCNAEGDRYIKCLILDI